MAIPTVGKCIVVLLLVLVLYTGNAFRIRDAVQSTGTVEKLRSNVCGTSTLGKCTDDVSRADSSSTLALLSKRKYRSVGSEANRAQISSKTRQTSVDTETSEESIQYVGKTSSISSFMKMRMPEAKIKLQRSVMVDKSVEEEDDEVVVANDDDDDDDDDKDTDEADEEDIDEIDADSDDDGVEISTSDGSEEGSEVVIDDSENEDDYDKEEEEEDNKDYTSKREEERNDDKQSNIKVARTDDKQERDDDDDENENIVNDDEDDDKEEIIPEIVPLIVRKLEKVRLADKDRVKSIEISRTLKPVNVIIEKPMETKKDTTKIEKAKKAKDVVEKEAKNKKIDTEEKKLEVEAKIKDLALKVSVKSETPKSTTFKEISKAAVTKMETLAVPKTAEKLDMKKTGQESEKPKSKLKSEVKPSIKKKSVDSGPSRKDQSKSTTAKRTDASISLTELNEAIHWVPTFMPNFTVVEDPVCQQHGKIFLRQLRGHKLWALQMLDASAKIPSGLLRGNINQLGDFDQCLGITARVKVDEKTVKIQGKYCLATLDLYASIPDMKVPVNLMQSRGFIRANMRDPGHFVPRFTTANWALCIPAACSADDARSAVESGLNYLNVSSGIRFNVDVDPEMCYVRQKGHTYSKETIAVIYFYAMITCVVLVATMRDYLISAQGKENFSERIIMSFSLKRTLRILTKEGRSDTEEISCINGIRSLATVALYVAHKMIPITQIPYANRIAFTEVANNPMSSVLRTSSVYTDCFLLLSGLLTAFNMARERSKRGEIRWFCRFVARFIRLTPTLLITLFWYAYVMEHTGSGPQWNSVIATNAELCKQNLWTNILYIQNFFPFEEMCATHTHQLALDMQLSLLAPVLIFFLTFKPIIGILLIFLLLQISATLRYFATTNNYLSLVIFHGMSLKHLYKTANLTYSLPLHRASAYVIGVGLGALLHYTGKNVKIYKIFLIVGWVVAAALGSWALFSPWQMARKDYTYNVEEAAQYAVTAPVSWSLALCWIIFACYTDHGGILNKFLSHYWMVLFSRISYAVYLCQFAIFFYNVGTTRYSSVLQAHRLIDPYEASVVIFVSVILTLFVDIPMQEVKNVIMVCTDGLTIPIGDREEKTQPKKATIAEESKVIVSEEIHEEEEEEDKKEHDESENAEWDWVEQSESRMSVEEDGLVERRRRSQSSQRGSIPEQDKIIHELTNYQYHQEDFRRNRRSVSTHSDRIPRHDESAQVSLRKERLVSRASEPKSLYPEMEDSNRKLSRYDNRGHYFEQEQTRAQSCEPVRHERPRHSSISRREPPRVLSSGSEDESIQHQQQQQHHKPTKITRRQSIEPKVSDEEDWEQELRIRRRRFMERLASENRSNGNHPADEGNDGWDGVKRRSSAEGKLALLKDPMESNVMDSWTVSRGSRVLQPGSSQETEDDSADIQSHDDYYENRRETLKEDDRSEEESSVEQSRRLSLVSGSQVTSLEDEEDVKNNDFVLKKESKKISVMDLSKLSQEESEPYSFHWNVVQEDEGAKDEEPKMATLKLFKRESIVKSQASEEDPEYVLPERPKLLEQEQDHPFKKAWQLQKSRSEEDPSAYALKEIKTQPDASRSRNAVSEDIKESRITQSSGTESILENPYDDIDDIGATGK